MGNLKKLLKQLAVFGVCGTMVSGLVACGANSFDSASDSVYQTTNGSAWDAGSSFEYVKAEESYDAELKEEYKADGSLRTEISSESGESASDSMTSRKVIKTAELNMQTLDFTSFQEALEHKIEENGAYLQYADVSGESYYGGRKSANYTIRVPEAKLDLFLAGMEGIATVVNKTLGEEDVTFTYVDTETRIKTLEIEQERLLALLEKAEDLDSIILLEQRLSEVRYDIESYQSRLRMYDDKITYSTVYLSVYEVTRVTEKEPENLWERIRNGWADTIYDISTGAQDCFVWVVVNLPYLVFWGVVIAAFVVVMTKKHAKHKAKKIRKQNENNETELDSKE